MAANEVNKKLVDIVEKFYEDVVDDFKEAEGIIINESKFTSIFKKKNHDRNIKKLRSCKKKCIVLPVETIKLEAGDDVGQEVMKNLERTRFAFNALCDAHIQLQLSLQKKSDGEKVGYGEYKEIYNRVNKCRTDLNSQLHELDIIYTDYTYDEDEDPYEFL
ncbi:MAG: hypothetical protein KBS66_04735 [Eubacterium sp.]|nr:hypothetical protein [Candidatus Colimonas fimequi]